MPNPVPKPNKAKNDPNEKLHLTVYIERKYIKLLKHFANSKEHTISWAGGKVIKDYFDSVATNQLN